MFLYVSVCVFYVIFGIICIVERSWLLLHVTIIILQTKVISNLSMST